MFEYLLRGLLEFIKSRIPCVWFLSHRLLYKRSKLCIYDNVLLFLCPMKIPLFLPSLCFVIFITNVRIFLLLFRDALITCIVNTLTCLTAGVLVFSILGYMAHLQEKTVDEVARSGPGLVFLTYPELVLSLPASFIWAILFFAMLLVNFEIL